MMVPGWAGAGVSGTSEAGGAGLDDVGGVTARLVSMDLIDFSILAIAC